MSSRSFYPGGGGASRHPHQNESLHYDEAATQEQEYLEVNLETNQMI